jgi:chorismate--pyruvate lyase
MTSRPIPAPPLRSLAPCWTPDPASLEAGAVTLGWLTEPGLLTERVRRGCAGEFGLRVVDERHDLLAPEDAAALRVQDLSAFVREVELTCDGAARVFAQTLVPAATLAAEPWLALLGNDPLGPRLALLGGALRDPLEFTLLGPEDALFARACRAVPVAPEGLWARRARYRLATHCLIVQEVFLPGVLA